MNQKTYHTLCRWTFHAGKGGFTPANMRPAWSHTSFSTSDFVRLTKSIGSRLPAHMELGIELHYDNEINEKNAAEVTEALLESKVHLAMITPGLHGHFAYGGPCSLDSKELKLAREFSTRTVDLAYGVLRKAWHPKPELAPTFVIWNGSYGYDLATPAVAKMYHNLKESIAALCRYEAKSGDKLFFGIEPKPNEGHPAMLLPTVASAILLWKKIEDQYGISLERKGINKEIGHSEMIGLDPVLDTVEEIEHNALVHMHLNSQGLNDGIIHGGPGKFDIDHGVRVNGLNIAIARLIQDAKYNRWKGHDMQVRPYDSEEQGIDRVVRSLLSWEACERAARELDNTALEALLSKRETAKAEDLIRHSVISAQGYFDQLYTCRQ